MEHISYKQYFPSFTIQQIQPYFKKTISKSVLCTRGSRIKSDDKRESSRTGNESTRGLSAEEIFGGSRQRIPLA